MYYTRYFIYFYILSHFVIYCQNFEDCSVEKAKSKDWSFFVGYMRKMIDGEYHHYCGGSLITEQCVLTTASCVVNIKFGEFSIADYDTSYVILGTVKGYTNCTSGECTKRLIKNVKIHPEYNLYHKVPDLAVLILDEPVTPTVQMSTVKLAEKSPKNGDTCKAAGIGRSAPGEKKENENEKIQNSTDFQDILLEVNLPIMGSSACRKQFRKFMDNTSYSSDNICTCCTKKDGDNKCYGNFGGPLTCNGELTGISSWAFECEAEKNPMVFVNVLLDRNWIINSCDLQFDAKNERMDHSTPAFYSNSAVSLIGSCYFKIKLCITIYLLFHIYKYYL